MVAASEPLLPRGASQASGVRWKRLVSTAHFSAAWGERMWEFAAGLMLLRLAGGNSLALPAALAFSMLLSVVLFGSKVGVFLDRTDALHGPLCTLGVQSATIASAALCAVLPDVVPEFPFEAAVAGTILFSSFAKLASIGSRLSIEKRWAKALAGGSGTEDEKRARLAELNGLLRTIDLSCKVMAPAMAGVVMSFLGTVATGCLVAAFNLLAYPLEVCCLRKVYADPHCQELLQEAMTPMAKRGGGSANNTAEELPQETQKPWRLYFAQTGLWPSAFALSMLHLTVLSFGGIMAAYIRTLGVDVAVISIYRSVGEVFGITAALTAPKVIKRLRPMKSALLFIWLQLVCLIPSGVGASSWARGLHPLVSSGLLVGGVAVSRLGLWGFDLSVSQLIQEKVKPPSALGAVGGVQEALCSAFGALAAFSGMVLPDPRQFQYLVLASIGAVGSAALLHTGAVLTSKEGK